MSENNSFLVFSGTKTRYLAEKICASLGCPLGNLVMTRFSVENLLSHTNRAFVEKMYILCRVLSPIQTISWNYS